MATLACPGICSGVRAQYLCLFLEDGTLVKDTTPVNVSFCLASKAKSNTRALLAEERPCFFLKGPLPQRMRKWVFQSQKSTRDELTLVNWFEKRGRRAKAAAVPECIYGKDMWVASSLVEGGYVFSGSSACLALISIVCFFRVLAGLLEIMERELGFKLLLGATVGERVALRSSAKLTGASVLHSYLPWPLHL